MTSITLWTLREHGIRTEGPPARYAYMTRHTLTFVSLSSSFLLEFLFPRIIILNAWIALLLITSSTNGYDGSMMNGLQALDQWKNAFGNPQGSKLGLLNAIQVGSIMSRLNVLVS
jgi:hypothetical protein